MGKVEEFLGKLNTWETVEPPNVSSLFNTGHDKNISGIPENELPRQQFGQLLTAIHGWIMGGMMVPSREQFEQMVTAIEKIVKNFSFVGEKDFKPSSAQMVKDMREKLGY